jgi:hypothetical protein
VKLVNVRLSSEDASMVAELRRDGVEISQLVRDAIRTEHGRRRRRLRPQDVDALLAAIYARHPEPAAASPRALDVRDRRAFRQAVARRLRSATKR